jgi:hypothetical protein
VTKRLESAAVGILDGFTEFTIVGAFADNQEDFVAHAAMLKDFVELPTEKAVDVWHIGPPLVAGERSSAAASEKDRKMRTEIVAGIALSNSERKKMTFV